MEPEKPNALALVPRAGKHFLGGFDRLREVQERAIPAIMSGDDVLIASATASGKTEAFAAPAAELALQAGCAPMTALVLTPTRALANDLKRRLEGPMERAGVSLGRLTGEHKEKVGGRSPAVVIATPEALDSALARRSASLSALRMLVMDEIHVLDGTARGDQLRVLLHRVDLAARLRPRRVAVSATIGSPEALASRYLVNPQLVLVKGAREIRAKAFNGRGTAEVASHVNEMAGHGARKILVFCNKRDDVERYSIKLRHKTRFADAIFAHHGSMSKVMRERTERQFQSAPAALCFATMTLEMGIDMGSIDYVLLLGVPSDVSSLLQRIGRGGRRGDSTRFGYVAADLGERHRMRTMAKSGARGELCAAPYGFRYSVLVQQALTLAGHDSVGPLDLRRAVPEELWPTRDTVGEPDWPKTLLDQLVEAELMERRGRDRYVLTEQIERRFHNGTLHSNLDDDSGVEVVDRMTGDVLGGIAQADTGKLGLAGSSRKVAGYSMGRVLTDSVQGAEPAKFRPRGKPITSFALARSVAAELGVPDDALVLHGSKGAIRLLHGLGSVGGRVLLRLLDGRGVDVDRKSLTPFSLDVAGLKEGPLEVPVDLVEACLGDEPGTLEKIVAPGPWAKAVPDAWRRETVRQASGLDDVVQFLRSARVVKATWGDEQALIADAL
jgi:ATP-dependent Lhr-like helicase